ncbi:MAG: DUF342 domain-containing protein, partial [Planctomycetes bacterium]|nr:DUF342 domain-containing protein [Planctomycetota bacterium]
GVRGRVLAARPGRPHRQRLGQGVRLDGDKVIATRSGVIVCTETSFDVLPLHLHRGDVDMKSGNLHTRGSLQVQGDVREGFAATAEGDVDVTGAVFDAAVTAGGSVRIGQGLLGAACEVRAAQDVRCRHATSAQLHAGNEIEIADQATHCRMYATKVRAVRGRGTVVGGEVHCRESIEVRTAGTPNGAATLLCVGDLLAEEAELARITAELARLERAVRRPADPRGAMPRPTVPATDRLQQERLLLLGKQRELLHRANIRITDTVHPGVILRFGTVSLPIALPIHGATFHFDHEHEAIVQGRL